MNITFENKEKKKLKIVSLIERFIRHWTESLFIYIIILTVLICPTPLPPGKECLKQFPNPGPRWLDLSWGLPGGGQKIEPCPNRQGSKLHNCVTGVRSYSLQLHLAKPS